MSRFTLLLSTILIVIVVAVTSALLFARELRQQARDKYYQDIANQKASDIEVTIPEGYRREQIAALLEEKGVTAADDFLAATKNDEGMLFPDTYRFFPASIATDVRNKLLQNYKTKIKDLGTVDSKTLIMASIVEREAKDDAERAQIAGVYWNRYNAGYALTADPTVQYGKDSNNLETQLKTAANKEERNNIIKNFDFWGTITKADYDGVESLYNTYRNAGLPPGPICNPGLASIKAAQSPAKHNYYYFFHTPDGQTIYSQTIDEHNANKLRFLK